MVFTLWKWKLDGDRLHKNDKMTANIKYIGSNTERLKRMGEKSNVKDNSKRVTNDIISHW